MASPGLTELNAVAAVAARRNFRAAARDLGVSASALSHAVAALEARLGVRLFNRTTRSVALTPAGEGFLARVEPALREIAEAMAEASEQRERPAGLLRINAAGLAAEQMLGPIVVAFLRRHSEMEIEIVSEGRLVDIVAEGFDAGVRLAETVPRDMIALPFGGLQRHVVVAAPSYLEGRRRPLGPADLREQVCIRFRLPGGALYRWEFAKRGEAFAVEVRGPLILDDQRLVLRAAIEGLGLAYVSEWSAREALADGRLATLLDEWTPPYEGLCLYYPSRRHLRAGLRAFTTFVRERNRPQR
ncbi:transcriptional regulator, LysR family [Tistlia consotensis]|uniref:DNA-binding transcriptional regulator, LysR family n=1 Tax=Tistlia consotensis USBA 355 TaxID=560819 RepID=A0A1Y6CRY9_9PROT|nr:LysR family transcriptional regulator [Tistlia consotensis]SMF73313.1 DNA-binding transcriptional regulator, LysR family [Tistlia consotensis USBA 355]SNS30716.1 transcriptional regulator, LysR family [Tistlia consotensis]